MTESVSWSNGFEKGAAAEAAYIEHEMYTRGDGCWRPWALLSQPQREHWYRVADAVFRAVNQGRFAAAAEDTP